MVRIGRSSIRYLSLAVAMLCSLSQLSLGMHNPYGEPPHRSALPRSRSAFYPSPQQTKISCPACTFDNEPDATECTICGTALPRPQRRSRPVPPLPGPRQQQQASAQGEEEGKQSAGMLPQPVRQVMQQPQRPVRRGEQFLVRDFFEKVVGMSEDDFRAQFQWNERGPQGRLHYFDKLSLRDFEAWKNGWIRESPERESIFTGDYQFETLGELYNKLDKKGITPLTKSSKFYITLHDPANPLKSDIACTQSDPEIAYKASFQLASTFFGPLEGGIDNPKAKLSDMIAHAVQGEWASLVTAGATIFRKYFMPTIHYLEQREGVSNRPQSYYLLSNLASKAPIYIEEHPIRGNLKSVNMDALLRYKFNPNDKYAVGIFTHSDIVPTSRLIKPVPFGADKNDSVMQQILFASNPTKITQFFNSAYNLIKYRTDYPNQADDQPVMQFAKMVMHAQYEADLIKAYLSGKPYIEFTLLGCGAFVNEIKWIAEFFEKPEIQQFIKDTGLEVNIIYGPDKLRDIVVRSAETDIDFLDRMYAIASTFQKIPPRNDIQAYYDNVITPRYAIQQQAAHGRQPRRRSSMAQKPPAHIGDNGQPIAADQPRPGSLRRSRTLASSQFATGALAQRSMAAAQPGTQALEVTPIHGTKRSDRYYLGWLYVPQYQDRALIKYDIGTTPERDAYGAENFVYVSPSAPSEALPAGLRYWQNSVQPVPITIPDDIGNHDIKVQVSETPNSTPFQYSRKNREYVPVSAQVQQAQAQHAPAQQPITRSHRQSSAAPLAPVPSRMRSSSRPAMRQPVATQLPFAIIPGAGEPGVYDLAWLEVPQENDAVLINLDEGAIPLQFPDGSTSNNFKYVSPVVPSVQLTDDLRYWRSSRQLTLPIVLAPGQRKHNIPVYVSKTPTGTRYQYSRQQGEYVPVPAPAQQVQAPAPVIRRRQSSAAPAPVRSRSHASRP